MFFSPKIFRQWAVGEARRNTMLPVFRIQDVFRVWLKSPLAWFPTENKAESSCCSTSASFVRCIRRTDGMLGEEAVTVHFVTSQGFAPGFPNLIRPSLVEVTCTYCRLVNVVIPIKVAVQTHRICSKVNIDAQACLTMYSAARVEHVTGLVFRPHGDTQSPPAILNSIGRYGREERPPPPIRFEHGYILATSRGWTTVNLRSQ